MTDCVGLNNEDHVKMSSAIPSPHLDSNTDTCCHTLKRKKCRLDTKFPETCLGGTEQSGRDFHRGKFRFAQSQKRNH